MATYKISSAALDKVGFYKVARNFLMFPRKGWHLRVDQKPVNAKGDLSVPLFADGKPTGAVGYIISSFHIKRDNNFSFISTEGMKIVDEESKYVYFAYAGGGVWQPIWGYQKRVQMHKGEKVWQPDNTEMDSETWGFACDKARWFADALSKATGQEHAIAMGPVRGAQARLFEQL